MIAAERLNNVNEYYFSRKLKEVKELISQGKPVINMGIGSPDMAPHPLVIDAIQNSLLEKHAHQYQSYQGIPELREAMADFYSSKYGVEKNKDLEFLPLMGSKEGIMHISLAFLNKNDQVLIPNPGYPTYTSVTEIAEAKGLYYDLTEENHWMPNLDEIEKNDLSKVKIMWINYPHMPTGTNATLKLYEDLVAFGKKHNILIVNDNPYSFVLNPNPLSIFQVDGAKDIALELNSLSKSFNMAGWRVGMVLGNSKLIETILKVKSNMDSGMFYGIQKGAIKALELDNDWFKSLNNVYAKRRELIFQLADKMNCTYKRESTGLFVWAKLPLGIKSEEYIDELLYKHHIFLTPGTVFGTNGEGYIRFSLCVKEEQIVEAISRLI